MFDFKMHKQKSRNGANLKIRYFDKFHAYTDTVNRKKNKKPY